jgi:chitin disaccharide deacetylase
MPEDAGRLPQLIVNADDLGLRADWDDAICAALARGVVRSVSILTTGPTYTRARQAASALGADVGVHLDLVSGRPLSPLHEIASLVDHRGAFPGRWRTVALRELRGRLATAEVEREWSRQIERAIDDGLAPTHLDGHYHLHLLPRLFPIALRLARRFGIGVVRVPDERPRDARTAVLWALARRAARTAPLLGRVHCRGVADAGRLGLPAWTALLESLPPGVTEIVCHPGQSNAEDAALGSDALAAAIAARACLSSFRSLGSHAHRVRPELRP